MPTLPSDLRRQLEKTVVAARDIADAGAERALEALAIPHPEPHRHMTREQRALRNRLRVHALYLGDRAHTSSDAYTIDHLTHECAYEHWHGMLFARFLAENQLLIEPEMEIAITLDECAELAKEKAIDKWVLAARFAHGMLPQVFRPDHPALEIQLAREDRLELEGLLEELPAEVFTATDALGWVYQFWQTKQKNEINRSEVKIGSDELPAVTQLFTEPYMVQFLLHNSLGAWWASRYPDRPCPVALTYLRESEAGLAAAGEFEAWPDELAHFRLLDPCCGSGHFLVAAFLMLVPMRMALEGASAAEAVGAVLRENLHGLELDQRCVSIAAFALALEAWRFPNAGGFRALPRLNLASCGQRVSGTEEQWLALAAGDPRIERGMAVLYDIFRHAPTLGSLIDPSRAVSEDLLTAGFGELQPLLEAALQKYTGENASEREWEETAIAALGLTDAARMLCSRYHLVITNVPYLSRRKQSQRLRQFSETQYPRAKNDLANVFLERCLELSQNNSAGVTQIVMPQNWLFLTSYKTQREHLLKNVRWKLLAKLGPGAFETISGEVVKVVLLTLGSNHDNADHSLRGIDASHSATLRAKKTLLQTGDLGAVHQRKQLSNPDARILLEDYDHQITLLGEYAHAYQGITSGDVARFSRVFWEMDRIAGDWVRLQGTVRNVQPFGGKSHLLLWGTDDESLPHVEGAVVRGRLAWDKEGVACSQMGELPVTLYDGAKFDSNTAIISPFTQDHLIAIWTFCSSPEFHKRVRRIDKKLNVTNATLVKIPFDLSRWTETAQERYPNGLPRPYTDDPTQWLFHGHPCGSVVWDESKKWPVQGKVRTAGTVLQVAVARLLGYRWPVEHDRHVELDDEQRAWVEEAERLYSFEDDDGIACIPSVRGEPPAHERLQQLLRAAYGDDWDDSLPLKLLAGSSSASLDGWLRDRFFAEHCKLFRQRPFIWHIWDGRKRDGFHALVNYHKLAEGSGEGRRRLESLTHSYLGDWIIRQQDGVKRGEAGADDRLVAALELQKRLVAILRGEPPFDLFVRWKPLDRQPIGWAPGIDDGVRLNIRPFMAQDLPGGTKGAGALRTKPNIHWKKDRGKEPSRDAARFPWFWKDGTFTGERVNDIHLTNAQKRDIRETIGGKQS